MIMNLWLPQRRGISNIIRVNKLKRVRGIKHVAHMGETRNAYKVLVSKPEVMRPLGRTGHRLEDNIKMDLKEIVFDTVD
jgi:hypothetical protein